MSLRRMGGVALCLVVLMVMGCDSGSGVRGGDCDDAILSVLTGRVARVGTEPELCGSDEFVIETGDGQAPFIDGDTLTVTASYGGGCTQHDLTLVPDSGFKESNPVQLDVTVVHDAHGDACEAYETDTYVFDLSPIKTLYQEGYRTDEGVIVLHLWGLERPFYTLTYAF